MQLDGRVLLGEALGDLERVDGVRGLVERYEDVGELHRCHLSWNRRSARVAQRAQSGDDGRVRAADGIHERRRPCEVALAQGCVHLARRLVQRGERKISCNALERMGLADRRVHVAASQCLLECGEVRVVEELQGKALVKLRVALKRSIAPS